MAAGPKGKDGEPKRLNRVVGAGEAIGRVLDPAFRKRGFASRDIITHWGAMAPKPYDRVAAPDRLVWPRGERGAGGAVLYLRCAEGHQLALAHEGERISAAINRYFGYILVESVRLSAEPLVSETSAGPSGAPEPSARAGGAINDAVVAVADDGLRDALRQLGRGIMGRSGR